MRPLEAGDPESVGDGRYRLVGRLGQGGMGVVYLGRSRSGRAVAVKVVRPELGTDPEFLRRFAQEVASARRVGGFHTAPVVDADPDGRPAWLVTAYVPGPTLRTVLDEVGTLPADTLSVLAAGLAEALEAIHRAGVIHRDLKPANIVVAEDGPRVIDFGIARALDGSTALTRTGLQVGTPGYLAPEQLTGGTITPAVDMFALGVVLCQAAGGSPFGEGGSAAWLYRVVHEEPDLGPVPGILRAQVAACLAKDPAQRPTPAAFLDGLTIRHPADGNWLPDGATVLLATAPADATTALMPETDTRDRAEAAARPEPAAPTDHTERTEPTAPTDHTERTEPTAPTDRTEQTERTGRTEQREHPERTGDGAWPGTTPASGPVLAPEPVPLPVPVPAPTPAYPEVTVPDTPVPGTGDGHGYGPPGHGHEPGSGPGDGAGAGSGSGAGTVASPEHPEPRPRRRGLLTAVAVAVCAAAVAGVVIWAPWQGDSGDRAEGGKTGDGASAGPSPDAFPTAPLLVRQDTAPGWPQECHAVIAVRPAATDSPRQLVGSGTGGEDGVCDMLPQWAPDRGSFAFTRRSADGTTVWTAKADGSDARRVAAIAGGRVSWSPDGTRLAVLRAKDGVQQLFEVTVADGSARQLTFGKGRVEDPAWSPDGKRIAVCLEAGRGNWQIHLVDPADPGSAPRQVTRLPHAALDPVWSPDGRTFAYTAGTYQGPTRGDVRLVGSDGSGDRPLVATADHEMDPAWSANGRWVAFVRGPYEKPVIWAVRADGTGERRLTTGDKPEAHPAWR
ncbi:protein kinase domain-containing protein [Streptomyces roseicoloratus]|uniref:protein kinase domain-containing protein n=1 Tax=Streptomyces roseicoloratus TaxID=2508722 RepID=UPI001009CE1E|nr:protein kinase [Streptomyces roseicoloratus]